MIVRPATLGLIGALGALGLGALTACDDAADPYGRTADATTTAPLDWCDRAPIVTWDNFGAGFLVENCQPCHASASLARHDAPEDIAFDTLDDARALRQRILVVATGDEPEMPPAGGVSVADRALLEVWLRCGLDDPP